jgi:paraquat-inducible protein B
MPEPSNPRRTGDLPEAVIETSGRFRPQLVWVIPIVAALIGGWLAVKSILEHGPTVTIAFATAQGIEAGKTKIRYKNVEIGEVRTVTLSDDDKQVIAKCEFTKAAAKYLVKDTRFWVVRPRVGAGGISGLGTLFSGAYLGIDVGKSHEPRFAFTGLEVPPIVTSEVPGREFVLHGRGIGSLDVGSPIYFRHIQVGQVVAFDLDADGKGVTFRVFINSPYERYVTTATRFWHASGVDMTLDANGIRVQTESLATILAGGIAFEDSPNAAEAPVADAGSKFNLASDRVQAMARPDRSVMHFQVYFENTLRGLSPGAPVDFGGVIIGEVTAINIEFDPRSRQLRFPVSIDVFPDRWQGLYRKGAVTLSEATGSSERALDLLVEKGYRAQLRTGNLVTGQLYVAFDRFPNAPQARVDRTKTPPELPTTPGSLAQLQQTLSTIAAKIEHIPMEEVANDARRALQTLNRTLESTDQLVRQINGDIAPDVAAVLVDARKTLDAARLTLASDSPQLVQVRQAMGELARAAESVRLLADTLEKNPESLIRGKKEDKP